jgi:hypothetical protein
MKKEEDKIHQSWFVLHEGVPVGPLPGAKIRGMLLRGELSLSDQISLDRKRWARMVSVPEVVPLQMRADAGDAEAQALLAARKKSEAYTDAEERRFPVMAMVVVLLVIAGVIGFAIWVGIPQMKDSPQCDAVPAPGVNWRNCLLTGVDAGSASLAGADLSSAILRDARLSATDLNGANMQYINLSGANLSYAQLNGANLMGANLQGADLRGADLSNSDLRYADLSRSLIENALFTGAHMEGVIWFDGTTCSVRSVGRCTPASP